MGFTCVADGKFAVNACTQYYECYYTSTQYANKQLFDCPSGLIFDNLRLICDYPGNVFCDNSVGATTIVTSNQITSSTKTTVTFKKTTGILKNYVQTINDILRELGPSCKFCDRVYRVKRLTGNLSKNCIFYTCLKGKV